MIQMCVDARLWGNHGIGTILKNSLPFLAKHPSIDLTLLHYPKDLDALSRVCSRSILMNTPIYSIKEQYELARKIPRVDLFWTPHFNIPLLPILARKRLVSIHDVYFLVNFSKLSFKKKCYVKMFYNAALAYSDMVMTISHSSKRDIENFCSVKPKHIEVLPITTKLFNEKGINFQKKLPDHYLLYVGRIVPHKNLFRLIKAYEKLECELPLVVVGSLKPPLSEYQYSLISYVKQSSCLCKSVHFVGEVEDADLPGIYQRAELLIFPSYYEGFGLPPLEAMLFDCPVLASNISSVQEVCGDAVEYIDPNCVDSICKGMNRLIKDRGKQQQLIEKGRERAQRYSPKKMKDRLIEVIDVCCHRA